VVTILLKNCFVFQVLYAMDIRVFSFTAALDTADSADQAFKGRERKGGRGEEGGGSRRMRRREQGEVKNVEDYWRE
jgi:hypothetical protein